MFVYVISLPNSPRRETLQERLLKGGIEDYEIWNAIEPYEGIETDIFHITNLEWSKCSLLKNERKNRCRQACWLSHITLLQHLVQNNINEALILEDDIVFKENIYSKLASIPLDSVASFLDRTWKIEGTIPEGDEDWKRIDKCRVWCAGAIYYHNISKVILELISHRPKLWDKCLIDYIQKNHPTYYLNPKIVIQDRNTFTSTIC